MTLTLLTGPATEPVDLADAKLHLRVDSAAEDTLIQALISSARLTLEAHGNLAMINQTWGLRLDKWPGAVVHLPIGPVSAIHAISVDGVALPGDTYALIPGSDARIVKAENAPWPVSKSPAAGIEIRFEVGFGPAAADVPRDLHHAILMLVAEWFENREAGARAHDGHGTLPRAVIGLMARHRKVRL
ncbi:MAG: head-tail connector protein [Parvibaculum sp.]